MLHNLDSLFVTMCQNKMQVDQEDQKPQSGENGDKKSETEEMEVIKHAEYIQYTNIWKMTQKVRCTANCEWMRMGWKLQFVRACLLSPNLLGNIKAQLWAGSCSTNTGKPAGECEESPFEEHIY